MCHESDVDDNAEKKNCSFAIIQTTVTDKDGNPYDSKVLEEIVSYEQSLLVRFMNLILYYDDKKNSVGIQVNEMANKYEADDDYNNDASGNFDNDDDGDDDDDDNDDDPSPEIGRVVVDATFNSSLPGSLLTNRVIGQEEPLMIAQLLGQESLMMTTLSSL